MKAGIMQRATNFDRILGILCSVLDAYSAAIFLPASDGRDGGGDLYLASSFSLGDKINHGAVIGEGKGLIGWIMRNGEPLLVSNFDQRKNYLGYYRDNEEQSIKAFMGCALSGGAGVVCIDSKRQYSFAEKDQKLLHLFSDLLGQIQQESGDNEEKKEALKFYSALRTIYTLRHQYSRWAEFLKHYLELMTAVTGFSYCALFTRDATGQEYTLEGESEPKLVKPSGQMPSFPVTHGIIGWVFRNAAPVVSGGSDGASDTPLVGGNEMPQVQTIIAQPLNIQRKTRGVLCLCSEKGLRVGGGTRDFVRMASEHLALFLENLYVKCRLRDLHQAEQARMTIPAE